MRGFVRRPSVRALVALVAVLEVATSACAGTGVVMCFGGDGHVEIELALQGGARCTDLDVADACFGRTTQRDCGDVPLLLPAHTGVTAPARAVDGKAALVSVTAVLPRPVEPGGGRDVAPPAMGVAGSRPDVGALATIRLIV